MKSRILRQTCLAGVAGLALLAGCRGSEKTIAIGPGPAFSPSALAESASGQVLPATALSVPAPVSLSTGADVPPSTPLPDEIADSQSVTPIAWQESVPAPPPILLETNGEGSPPSPSGSLLTLDELQQLALAGNPTLRQAQALLQQARGNWLQVGLYPNPVIGYDGTGNNAAFDQQGAFISQNIVTGKKLKLNRAVASYDVQRAQWEAETQSLRVINEIRIRYIAALGAQRQVAVAEDLLKVAGEGVKISEQLLQGEQVSRADVLQARLQLSQTQILLRNARFRADAAWKQLGNVIGSPNFPVRPLEGNLAEDVPEVDWDFAWQRILDESPLLNAARARVAAARIQVRRERVQPIPDLQVVGMTWHDAINPPNQMYGLNVGVALPVFNRNQGNVAAAAGELRAAQSEVVRLELAMRDRLADAFQRNQSARNEVQTYRNMILPTAEENLSFALKGYEEGQLDFLRVLTARRDLFQANIDYVNALTELRIATIEILGMQLIGGLEPVNSNPIPSNQAGQTSGAGN